MKIGKGSTRIVLILSKFVIKIPSLTSYKLFLNGILSNLSEKQWSGHHADLARVYYCNKSGLFLVMERARVVSNNVNWLKFENMLEDKYKNDELKDFLLSDAKPSNWGYISGKLKKIDYA